MGKWFCTVIFFGYQLIKISFNQYLRLSKNFVEFIRKFSLSLQKQTQVKRFNSEDSQNSHKKLAEKQRFLKEQVNLDSSYSIPFFKIMMKRCIIATKYKCFLYYSIAFVCTLELYNQKNIS